MGMAEILAIIQVAFGAACVYTFIKQHTKRLLVSACILTAANYVFFFVRDYMPTVIGNDWLLVTWLTCAVALISFGYDIYLADRSI
jgi:hypothetical protein